jgi:hypothetical protein
MGGTVMIDKVFEYVQHEYNNVIRTLEAETSWMNPTNVINGGINRAYGAISFFCIIHPELEDDVKELWKVWDDKFFSLY